MERFPDIREIKAACADYDIPDVQVIYVQILSIGELSRFVNNRLTDRLPGRRYSLISLSSV